MSDKTISYADMLCRQRSPIRVPVCAGVDAEISEASGPNILEWLNEDCWRVVLDYVPVEHIVRSERVSRRWQGIVHAYLREVGICLVSIRDTFEHHDPTILKMHPKNRILIMKFNGWLAYEMKAAVQFVDKWGQCIVYSYCPSRRGALVRIAKSCPNLKSISIEMHNFGTGDLSQDMVEFVEKLERISFLDYTGVDNLDDTMDLCDPDIRKAVFAFRDAQVSAAFWRNFRPTNLKSLTLRGGFDLRYFLSAIDCFPKLTELVLQGQLKNAYMLFEKTPKLERLYVMDWGLFDREESIKKVYQCACSGLRCLKHFSVWQSHIDNCWLEAVLTGCRGLRFLDVRGSGNLNCIKEICEAHGSTLTDVRLIDIYTLTDEDVVTLIRFCPNLTSLDLRLCGHLSEALVENAASAAQGRALRLHIGGTNAPNFNKIDQAKFPELIVEIEAPPANAYCYYEATRPRQYIWGIEDHRDFRDRTMQFV